MQDIHDSLNLLKTNIEREVPNSRVGTSIVDRYITKLLVSSGDATIKIEPNLIIRGSIAAPIDLDLSQKTQDHFQVFVAAQTLSTEDLYGGKLCAALDRQHPRDLFDVKLLLDDPGITPEIRRAFVVYLAEHNRPMSELLDPRLQDIKELYEREFAGMVTVNASFETLKAVQKSLAPILLESLDDDERHFLISMKSGDPDWDVLEIEGLQNMPALQWKLLNIRKMDARKRNEQLEALQDLLGG